MNCLCLFFCVEFLSRAMFFVVLLHVWTWLSTITEQLKGYVTSWTANWYRSPIRRYIFSILVSVSFVVIFQVNFHSTAVPSWGGRRIYISIPGCTGNGPVAMAMGVLQRAALLWNGQLPRMRPIGRLVARIGLGHRGLDHTEWSGSLAHATVLQQRLCRQVNPMVQPSLTIQLSLLTTHIPFAR